MRQNAEVTAEAGKSTHPSSLLNCTSCKLGKGKKMNVNLSLWQNVSLCAFLNYAIYVFIVEPYSNNPFIFCPCVSLAYCRTCPHVLLHNEKESMWWMFKLGLTKWSLCIKNKYEWKGSNKSNTFSVFCRFHVFVSNRFLIL